MRLNSYFLIFVAAVSVSNARAEQILIPVNLISVPDYEAWSEKSEKAMKDLVDFPSCTKAGGQWLRMGLGGNFGCELPTRDGGKVCDDDDQCEMICQPIYEPRPPGDGYLVKGQCTSSYALFGCWQGMKFGKPRQGEICID